MRKGARGNPMTSSALTSVDVSVSFEGLRALNKVSLSIPRGRVTGLIGPNGAGKTTMVNVLTGFQTATEGHVSMDGLTLDAAPAHRIRHLGIARTFQSGRLFGDLPVLDNLAVTGVGLGLSRKEAEERAEAMLAWIGISSLADRIAGSLPYTDERRVAIARALMLEPKYLLLDEPAAGMNPSEARELMHLIRWVRDTFGVSILLIEHHMAVVMGICERITVLDHGARIAEGRQELSGCAFSGEAAIAQEEFTLKNDVRRAYFELAAAQSRATAARERPTSGTARSRMRRRTSG